MKQICTRSNTWLNVVKKNYSSRSRLSTQFEDAFTNGLVSSGVWLDPYLAKFIVLSWLTCTNLTFTAVNCGKPSEITNGKVIGSKYEYGHHVTYICDPGYNMTDPTANSRTCSNSGYWTGVSPTCLCK